MILASAAVVVFIGELTYAQYTRTVGTATDDDSETFTFYINIQTHTIGDPLGLYAHVYRLMSDYIDCELYIDDLEL
jgi:hypothetical protein